jgi:two-component system sensor histidine kinase UhpB
MEDVRQQIASTLEGIRRYARGLRPPALDELGLVPAIESYARTLTEGSGLPVIIHGQPLGNAALSKEEELALYRIVQEALSNVVRHAGATQAEVRVRRAGGMVVASVHDDGLGFDVARVLGGDGGGLGLFGMQERAAYVGGHVSIDSAADQGTTVRVEVPVWRPQGGAE